MLPWGFGPAMLLAVFAGVLHAAPASVAGAQSVDKRGVEANSLPPVEALHAAVRAGNLDQVKRLIQAGVDPDGRDALGSTPVLDAAWSGNVPVLNFLISQGADVNATHREAGSTPLFYAVLTGRADVAQVLLAAGARVDTKYRGGQTVLHVACARGKPEIAELLITAHASIGALDDSGRSPLDEAVLHDKPEALAVLIAHGADVRRVRPEDGRGAMAEACVKGYSDLLTQLVGAGASLTTADRYGETPLDLALAYKNPQTVKELLRLGLRLSESQTAAAKAMESATLRGQVDIARALADGGFDVNSRTDTGSTYLHDAALKGQAKMVRFLLERGARLEAVDSSGATPLHDAALGGSPEVIGLLVDHGAEVNARDKDTGATPLMLAASMGRSVAVAALLDRGANAALRDRAGHTALDRARETEDADSIRLLEAAGVNARERHRLRSGGASPADNFVPKY